MPMLPKAIYDTVRLGAKTTEVSFVGITVNVNAVQFAGFGGNGDDRFTVGLGQNNGPATIRGGAGDDVTRRG